MIGRVFEGWHLIIILIIVLVLFGRGKVSEFMGDFAKGIKSFKKGLKEDEIPSAKAQMGKTDEPNQPDSHRSGADNKSGQ